MTQALPRAELRFSYVIDASTGLYSASATRGEAATEFREKMTAEEWVQWFVEQVCATTGPVSFALSNGKVYRVSDFTLEQIRAKKLGAEDLVL